MHANIRWGRLFFLIVLVDIIVIIPAMTLFTKHQDRRAFYPLSTYGDKKFTSIEINEAWIEILDYIAALVKGNHKNNIPFPTYAVQIMQKWLRCPKCSMWLKK